MLKSTVPTPVTTPVDAGGVASASSTNTSSSGNAKATDALQLRPISSSQWPVAGSNRTMRPVLGAPGVEPGGGGGSPPFALTTCSVIAVVRLPESSTAAYTTEPSELAASARGDRHRLEADRDLRRERQPARADRVDRQAIVRCVQREEPVAARREREGPDMPALEVGERAAAGGSGGHEEQDGGESTRDHVPFPLVRRPSGTSASPR